MFRGFIRVWLSVFTAPPDAQNLLSFYPFHTVFIIPRSTKFRGGGGYTGFTLPVCPLCIVHNTSRIHFIFTHLIDQLQKGCLMLSFVKNLNFWQFFKICTFHFALCPYNVNVKSWFRIRVLIAATFYYYDDTSRYFTKQTFRVWPILQFCIFGKCFQLCIFT